MVNNIGNNMLGTIEYIRNMTNIAMKHAGQFIESITRDHLPKRIDFGKETTIKAQALANEYFPKILEKGKSSAHWTINTGWPMLGNGMVKGIQFSQKYLPSGIESLGKIIGVSIEKSFYILAAGTRISLSYLEKHPTQAIVLLCVSIILGVRKRHTKTHKEKPLTPSQRLMLTTTPTSISRRNSI